MSKNQPVKWLCKKYYVKT